MTSTFEKVTNSLENWLNQDEVLIQPNKLQNYFSLADNSKTDFLCKNMETHPITLVNHNEVLDNDRLPNILLSALRNYFEYVFLFESYRSSQTWYLSEFSIRGEIFHLELAQQVSAVNLVPAKMTELDIYQIPTAKFLSHFDVYSENIYEDDVSFLIHPTHNVSVVMSTKLPSLWASTQVEHTQKLVNLAFSY